MILNRWKIESHTPIKIPRFVDMYNKLNIFKTKIKFIFNLFNMILLSFE